MTAPRTMSDSKCDRVMTAIRTKIVSGHLAPGSRMPTWDQMEASFQVGRPTLMRALERLKRDGFVYSSSTRGTFVAVRPPHLSRYAIVFPETLVWNRFLAAMDYEVNCYAQRQDKQLVAFHHTTANRDNESFARLTDEAYAHRFAGIIIMSGNELAEIPLFPDLSIGRVIVLAKTTLPGTPHVDVDRESFVNKSLSFLAHRGRKRVAVLTNDTAPHESYAQAIPAHGLATKPFWHLAAPIRYTSAAAQIVRLLLDNPDRPDALIITDDNLVESALSGVAAAGLRVPDDLTIVAHCNWSLPVTSAMPVTFLGFDSRLVLQTCLNVIDAQQRGEQVPPVTMSPALLAEEDVAARIKAGVMPSPPR